jgi:hypothetical protein
MASTEERLSTAADCTPEHSLSHPYSLRGIAPNLAAVECYSTHMTFTSTSGYDDDPELHDENDPEYRDEMFRTFQSLGWRPEDLRDKNYAVLYSAWLQRDDNTK